MKRICRPYGTWGGVVDTCYQYYVPTGHQVAADICYQYNLPMGGGERKIYIDEMKSADSGNAEPLMTLIRKEMTAF